jgi:CheY-like chemotaxis protein
VFSEPDRGACFTMIWPCSTGATTAPAPEPVAQASIPTTTARILLAEDEAELRELLSDYLAGLGHHVTAVRSGEEALSVAGHTTPPDLLITDVVMDGMNGRTLADAIRARFPGTRVLYLSGYTDDAILRRGVMASEVNFLQKPFALSTFAEVVAHALQDEAAPVPSPPH